jgi:endonuclease/exonuclease/phosphatase family metal-dependent hydrolase
VAKRKFNIGRFFVKWLMLITNVIFVLLMLVSLSGKIISPDILVLPAYTTLIFPFIVLINIFFVAFWALARKWTFLLSLSVILFCLNEISAAFPVHLGKTGKTEVVKPLKVLTYNTMLTGILQKHTSNHPNDIIKYILETNADIVCLQEFAVSPKDQYLTQNDAQDIFKKYPYKHYRFNQNTSWRRSGILTMSKYPIILKDSINLHSEFSTSIISDIDINGDTIRVINNYLESNRLTDKDRAMPIHLKENFDAENLKGTTLHLSKKLGAAYKIRSKQADLIRNAVTNSPYRLIVCGDFNDVPVSYTYSTIKGANLKDAFAEIGNGLGWTYNQSIYRFRIDYVMYDNMKIVDYQKGTLKASDHYPVFCILDLN